MTHHLLDQTPVYAFDREADRQAFLAVADGDMERRKVERRKRERRRKRIRELHARGWTWPEIAMKVQITESYAKRLFEPHKPQGQA